PGTDRRDRPLPQRHSARARHGRRGRRAAHGRGAAATARRLRARPLRAHNGAGMSRRLDGGDQKAEVPASPAPERTICVELNGTRADLEQGATVADAVEATGADSDRGRAVAVDGEVLPRSDLGTLPLEVR